MSLRKRSISAGWHTDARRALLAELFPAGVEAQLIRMKLAALPGPPIPAWERVREYAKRVMQLHRPYADQRTLDAAEDRRIESAIRAASARFVEAGVKMAQRRAGAVAR